VADSAVLRLKLPEAVPPGPLLLLDVSPKVERRTKVLPPPTPGGPVLLRVDTVELLEAVESPPFSVATLEVCRLVGVAGVPPFVSPRVLPRVLAVMRVKEAHADGAVHQAVVSR
jgi:hypothetical protein